MSFTRGGVLALRIVGKTDAAAEPGTGTGVPMDTDRPRLSITHRTILSCSAFSLPLRMAVISSAAAKSDLVLIAHIATKARSLSSVCSTAGAVLSGYPIRQACRSVRCLPHASDKPPQRCAEAVIGCHRYARLLICRRTASSCSGRSHRNMRLHTGTCQWCSGWRSCGFSVGGWHLISWSWFFSCSRPCPGIVARIHRPFTPANEPARNPLHSFFNENS
jgi:hypothetical protein